MPTHSTGHHITIRPNHRDNKEISFLWSPGIVIAELAFRPKKGLGFLIREGGTVKFAEPNPQSNRHECGANNMSFAWTGLPKTPSLQNLCHTQAELSGPQDKTCPPSAEVTR